ncbi:hypothetical protein ACOMHN_064635 [Nucella lapillus]
MGHHREVQPQSGTCRVSCSLIMRWSEHFKQLLNRSSSIDPSVIEQIPSRPLHMELNDPPMKDEVAGSIAELQCGKSAGPNGFRLKFSKQVVSR